MEVASLATTSRSDRDLDAFGLTLRTLVHELERDGAPSTATDDDVRRRVLVRMLRRTADQVAHPG